MAISRAFFAATNSFKRDIPVVASLVDSSIKYTGDPRSGSRDTAKIIAEYMSTNQNPFGAAEWRQYFGVEAGPEIAFEAGFDEWWNGPDPVDVYNRIPNPRLVSDTHLRPVFAPRFFTDIQKQTLHARSLQTLNQLGLEFLGNSESLEQNRNKKAGSACWLVMRKDVLEKTRSKSWKNQQGCLKELNAVTGANYEEKPSVVDLATVIFSYKKMDGERHLGDDTGKEGCYTFSRCRETSDCGCPLVIGGFAPSGVDVRSRFSNESIGVAALRKF